jgi:CheY-like chemotaxis protein
MLIRTKLLMLAAVPLPVLLVLGLASLAAWDAQFRAAEQLATAVRVLQHAFALDQAVVARRDLEAAAASVQSRGLEALLLGESGEAPVAAPPVDAAVERATTELAALATADLAPALRQAVQAVVARARELGAPAPVVQEPTLGAVMARYEGLLGAIDVLPEIVEAGAAAGAGASSLRGLALLEQLYDAVASERIYVRHAILTNSLAPDLVRDYTVGSGLLEERLKRLRALFPDGEVAERLERAFAAAEAAGRGSILRQIDGYAARQDRLSLLYDAMGYGGMIYHYRNYMLRGDEAARSGFEAQAVAAAALIEQLLAEDTLSPAERADVQAIARNVEAHRARIAQIAALRRQGVPASLIDQRVRVPDAEALAALDRLAAFRGRIGAEDWDRMTTRLLGEVRDLNLALTAQVGAGLRAASAQRSRQRTFGLVAAAFTLTALLVLTRILYRRLSDGIAALVREFARVARTGDVETRRVVHGTDELAQLNEAVAEIGQRLQVMATAAEAMAAGNIAETVAPLGPQDRLASAMAELAKSAREVVAQAEAISAGDYATKVEPRSGEDTLAFALADMGQALRNFRSETERTQWLSEGHLRVLAAIGNADAPDVLGERALRALAELGGAPLGLMFLLSDGTLQAVARFGTAHVDVAARLEVGEGLVARALAATRTEVVTQLPKGYLRLRSGLGEGDVSAVTLTPLRARGEAVGVLELGWYAPPEARAVALLDAVAESLGLAVVAADARRRTETLLEETRRQAERLRQQQEQLHQSNEELEEQTQLLRQSEEELKSQREELQTTNEELQEKTKLLQRQREELEKTARSLAQATRYKSEFLANMSHELRTPLNSLLILSRSLMDNEEGNLKPDQVEAARVIHDGGRDLLNLINDILDLSKVEAGKLSVHPQPFALASLVDSLRRQFEPVARERRLELVLEVAPGLPQEMVSDRQRVEQILRNLLSNALKFTEKGTVALRIGRAPQRQNEAGEALLAFAVSDTGIGIPAEKLELIFQAFQQADGSTSRRFGGTGLGLTIARQLAGLLGGAVRAKSKVGEGSTFTLLLPERAAAEAAAEAAPAAAGAPEPAPLPHEILEGPAEPAPVPDDREAVKRGERSMLVIEDDVRFAAVVRDVVRRRGYKCIVATDGTSGLRLAKKLLPSAILLDLRLPDMEGRRVLDMLKWSAATRHIPVHVVSAQEPSNETLKQGAIGFLHKPAGMSDLLQVVDRIEQTLARERRTVLVVEDDASSQAAIRKLLANDRTEVVVAGTAAEATARLRQGRVDCIVLDLSLPDADGLAFLGALRRDGAEHPPVVIYTGRELSGEEHRRLSELAQSIVIKGAASPDRLLDDVLLFLHAVEAELPEPQKQALARVHSGVDAFQGKKILIVDDDLRNVFALSALLRKRGLDVQVADNGQMALERLAQHPDTAIVLMDIMMPVMDGLEAIRRIRSDARFRDLPIIAVTAKAMAEDRRKCMEAGASDYMAKPLELEALLAMLRLWLGRTA